MLFAVNSPNNLGVFIYGDYQDIESLYEAIYDVLGDEYEYPSYSGAKLRVLGVCYDLRHALMGDRDYEFVDNGMDDDKKRRMSLLVPDKNLYLKIEVLWPEMIFVMLALNRFIELYAGKLHGNGLQSDLFSGKQVVWESSIPQVRLLQSRVWDCLRENLSPQACARINNLINDNENGILVDYLTQYLDLLNMRFMKMGKEKRLKSISLLTKRMVEGNTEYLTYYHTIYSEAKRRNCSLEDLRLVIDYPDDVEW